MMVAKYPAAHLEYKLSKSSQVLIYLFLLEYVPNNPKKKNNLEHILEEKKFLSEKNTKNTNKQPYHVFVIKKQYSNK